MFSRLHRSPPPDLTKGWIVKDLIGLNMGTRWIFTLVSPAGNEWGNLDPLDDNYNELHFCLKSSSSYFYPIQVFARTKEAALQEIKKIILDYLIDFESHIRYENEMRAANAIARGNPETIEL